LLEEELKKINERFERGEMKAFGVNQDAILKKFQAVRKLQAQLSMQQVALGMNNEPIAAKDFLATTTIDDVFQEKSDNTSELTDGLMKICNEVEHLSDSIK